MSAAFTDNTIVLTRCHLPSSPPVDGMATDSYLEASNVNRNKNIPQRQMTEQKTQTPQTLLLTRSSTQTYPLLIRQHPTTSSTWYHAWATAIVTSILPLITMADKARPPSLTRRNLPHPHDTSSAQNLPPARVPQGAGPAASPPAWPAPLGRESNPQP